MTLLDRYLLKEFSKNLFMVLVALMAIYILVDLFEKLDEFIAAKQQLSQITKYFLLNIPEVVEQLMPVCILLAGVVTLGILSLHYELIALKGGGLDIIRIISPIIAGGVIFTGMALAMGQWLLPTTVSATNKIWYEEVRQSIPKGIYREGSFYYRGQNGFYSFDRPYRDKTEYRRFSYAAWNDHYDLAMLLTAEKAEWRKGRWFFAQGQIKEKNTQGEYIIKIFDATSLALPETPENFFVPEYKGREMSISQAWHQARSDEIRTGSEAWQKFHGKLSYIFLGLPLLLLGLPMLIIVNQKWGWDLSLAIPASCTLAFASWVWWGAFQSMARAGHLHPVPAAWTMHVIVGCIGIYLLRRQNL